MEVQRYIRCDVSANDGGTLTLALMSGKDEECFTNVATH